MSFGMDKQSSELPAALFYKKEGEKWLSFDTNQEKKFENKERHGSCSIWYDEQKGNWFCQPINSLDNTIIGKLIKITSLDDKLQTQLCQDNFFKQLVVNIDDKNYLFKNNDKGYIKSLIPYENIEKLVCFYKRINDSEKYQLILSDGRLCSATNTINDKCAMKGTILNWIQNKIFIAIKEDNAHIKTIGLPLTRQYFDAIERHLLNKNPLIVTYNSSLYEVVTIEIQKNDSSDNDDSSQETVQQISCKPHIELPESKSLVGKAPIYKAITSEFVSSDNDNQQPILKITFCVAGTQYTRFVVLKKRCSYIQNPTAKYLPITGIIDNSYVCFTEPQNTKIETPSFAPHVAKEDELSDPLIIIQNILSQSSAGISARVAENIQDVFLPTYQGTLIIDYDRNGTSYLLQIDDLKDVKDIKLNLDGSYLSSGRVSIVLYDLQGRGFCLITPGQSPKQESVFSTPKTTKPTQYKWNFIKLSTFLKKHSLIIGGVTGLGFLALFYYFCSNQTLDKTIH